MTSEFKIQAERFEKNLLWMDNVIKHLEQANKESKKVLTRNNL